LGDGTLIVELTPRGRERAGSIIRRHRLAERLFTDSLAMDSESEIEQQACKFEHILSPEATDKICTFLGHPRTCPHGAPIPPGPCCAGQTISQRETVNAVRKFTRDEMHER
jgi:DtxR family Mn-dependent transcriptional regulator